MRSIIVRTSWAPSGWQKAPATPHLSASHSTLAYKCVVDVDICIALMWPAQLIVDPKSSSPTHGVALVGVVDEIHDCPGIGGHIAALDVHRSIPGRDTGLLEVEC